MTRLAPSDPDAAAALEDRMRRRRAGLTESLRKLDEAGKLSADWTVRQASDALWEAGLPSSYEHLVGERGWSVKTFERWLLHLGRSFLVELRLAVAVLRGFVPALDRRVGLTRDLCVMQRGGLGLRVRALLVAACHVVIRRELDRRIRRLAGRVGRAILCRLWRPRMRR